MSRDFSSAPFSSFHEETQDGFCPNLASEHRQYLISENTVENHHCPPKRLDHFLERLLADVEIRYTIL